MISLHFLLLRFFSFVTFIVTNHSGITDYGKEFCCTTRTNDLSSEYSTDDLIYAEISLLFILNKSEECANSLSKNINPILVEINVKYTHQKIQSEFSSPMLFHFVE